ncbi:hypothetical protein GE061_011697 [Apolygus lucorum]|uniref:Uncharacterized protein n=1 Tax=Apolygus lucorum TaxID=248454 RepID=A0A6A4KAX8_APOLU|nr:hypothetical protein GE061_011697 [Apolygus lucorum]
MPRSAEGVRGKPIDAEDMKRALVVDENWSVQGAAIEAEVSKSAPHWHLQKFAATRDHDKESSSDNFIFRAGMDVRKVFDSEKELALKQYIIHAAKIYHGLTIKEIKTLAYRFAKSNNIKYPTSWDNK